MKQNKEPKFIVDFMLGRLAKWLRIFGFDTLYDKEKNRNNLIINSLKQNRILLTRNHRLSSKRAYKLILIRSDHINEQIKQVVNETATSINKDKIFTRCTFCNEINEIITSKEDIKNSVPEYVYNTQNEFSKCPVCKKIYWPGTHWKLLLNDLNKSGIKLNS